MYDIKAQRDIIKKAIKKATDKAFEVLDNMSSLSSEIDVKPCSDVNLSLVKMRRNLDVIKNTLDFEVGEKQEIESDNKNVLGAQFYYNEETRMFYIVLPGRLPKRASVKDMSLNYDYDLSVYKQNMIRTFNSYFIDHMVRFNEKVNILIISHYNDKSRMCDYDNLDPKPLIDGIKNNMLIDDNPMFVRLIFDAVLDENGEEFTEVVVCPIN